LRADLKRLKRDTESVRVAIAGSAAIPEKQHRQAVPKRRRWPVYSAAGILVLLTIPLALIMGIAQPPVGTSKPPTGSLVLPRPIRKSGLGKPSWKAPARRNLRQTILSGGRRSRRFSASPRRKHSKTPIMCPPT
jgi:hypothetical protein